LNYRLLGGANADIERILTESAKRWCIGAADRYDVLMRGAFGHLGSYPLTPGSDEIPGLPGWRYYHLRLARTLVDPGQRVGNPRHLAIYRVGADEVVEIAGLAHDRMLLVRAARRIVRDTGR
jgi:plasmid stabilization system protein ParE